MTRLASRLNTLMRVSAGLFHHRLGFYFLEFLEARDLEEWLLSIDLDLMTNDEFDWNGESIPVDELNPTVIHLHTLDRAFNAHTRFFGRCADGAGL